MWRFGGIGLELHAMHQLVETGAGELGSRYESLGEDPQFDVRLASGIGQIVPGWYLLRARWQVDGGEIVAPCLYPDYGEGLSEATRIDLPEPDITGELRALVVIKRRLRSLRLDPTVHRAHFELSSVRLSPVSRLGALAEMVRGIAHKSRTSAWPVLKSFLRKAARAGVSTATDALYRRYMAAHRKNDRDYVQWTSMFSVRGSAVASWRQEQVSSFTRRPTISVVLPVHNPPLELLRRCIDSVVDQSYPNWELCIADDMSSLPGIRQLLERYAALEPRIRLHFRTEHGHICRTSNDALAMAEGEYVAFLDHDDELAPDALFEVARALQEHPEARMLYSDEDKIDQSGQRYEPSFKPAWNPDLLRACNYICHFTTIERSLVMEVGGIRPGFEGAQDHDLVLRCTERLSRDAIVHIPKILYHWRAIPGSTALSADQKPYALAAGQRAVAEHLVRIGRPAKVEVTASGTYRVVHEAPDSLPTVTIVIPTRDGLDLLKACVDSIRARTDYPHYNILVIDNGSIEPSTLEYLSALRQQSGADVVDFVAPFNYSAIMNHAARHATGEILCMLNNDVEVISPDWLGELVAHARMPEVGVVGGMLYYPNDTIQHAGVILGMGGVAGHVHARLQRGSSGYLGRASMTQNLTALTGACMVVRRQVYLEVGGMDEMLPVAFNDIDFCLRVYQRGYNNVWTPHAELYHHESASRGVDDTPEKRVRFDMECDRMERKWGDVLRHDPAYNPNLSLESHQFDLAFPPRDLRPRRAGLVSIPVATN